MKYILLFLCILSLSCKYNVANPVGTLRDYTAGSGIIYYVSSSAHPTEIADALRKNKHSLGKYLIKVSATNDTSNAATNILTNIATALTNNPSFNNVEVDISKLVGIKEIPEGVFSNAANLGSIMLSDNVSNIGKNAFSGCSSLSDIRFSNGLEKICEGAFSNCVSLTLVMLSSEKLTNIGDNAFAGCSSLVNLVLPEPASLEEKSEIKIEIKDTAFSSCSQLKNVEYLGTNANVSGSPFSGSSNPNNLYLPSATNDTIKGKFNEPFLGKSGWTKYEGKHIPN